MRASGEAPARRAVALALAAALALPGGLMASPAALAASAHKQSASATASSASSAAVTPAAPSSGGGLSGFPTPSVATTTSANATAIPTAATNNAGNSTLSGTNALIIVIGAVVILVAISWFIWRDARRRAPVRAQAGLTGGDGRSKPGSKAPPKARKLSAAERKRRKRGRAKR